VADHDIVDTLYFEAQVIEPVSRPLGDEYRVMIDGQRSPVAAIKRRDDVISVPRINFIRAAKSKRFAVPGASFGRILGGEDDMGQTLDL
jgi:hypothetical protein